MDLFARAVEAVRAEQRADKIILVGHSMGTPVIRQYARLYPQHVAALVIVDGVVMTPPPAGRGITPPVDPNQFAAPEGLQARERFIKSMFTPKTPVDVQRTRAEDDARPAGGHAPPAPWWPTFDPSTFPAEVMTMPTYGIYAEKSVLLGNPETVKKVFPKMELVEMPGTGHFVMMEQPAEFNRLLTRFLDSVAY